MSFKFFSHFLIVNLTHEKLNLNTYSKHNSSFWSKICHTITYCLSSILYLLKVFQQCFAPCEKILCRKLDSL